MMSLLNKAGNFASLGMNYLQSPAFGSFFNQAKQADMNNAQLQTQISVLDAQYKMYDKYLQKEFQNEARALDARA